MVPGHCWTGQKFLYLGGFGSISFVLVAKVACKVFDKYLNPRLYVAGDLTWFGKIICVVGFLGSM